MPGSICEVISKVSPAARAAIVGVPTLLAATLACSLPTSGASLPPTETGIPATLLPTTTPRPTNTPAFIIGYGSGSRGGAVSETPLASETPMNTPVIPNTNTPRPTNTLAPTETKTVTPSPTNTSVVPTNTLTATQTRIAAGTPTPSVDGLPRLNPECSLPERWVQTSTEANKALGGNFKDWQMVKKVDSKTNTWNGGWEAEAFNKMNSWIRYDAGNSVHIDTRTGKPTFDHDNIFDTSKGMTNVDVTLSDSNGWMFARRGGAAPAGLQKNVSFNVGTTGIKIEKVEQAAITPVCEVCAPESNVRTTDAEAWHNAVKEFTWNKDAQNGAIDVQVWDPRTSEFKHINGSMISALANKGLITQAHVEALPAFYPIHPNEAVFGSEGKFDASNASHAQWWVMDPKTGLWNMEAFDLEPGVTFNSITGLHSKNGKLVAEQGLSWDKMLDAIFNFKSYHPDQWSLNMQSPHGRTVFGARTGGAGKPAGSTWLMPGSGKAVADGPGFEQAWIENNVCTISPQAAAAEEAQRQDPSINVFVWNPVTNTFDLVQMAVTPTPKP